MGWRDLLETSSRLVIPWLGGERLYRDGRTWRICSPKPKEFGWYEWAVQGRRATYFGRAEPAPDYLQFWLGQKLTGYLVGNRFIPLMVNVRWELAEVFELADSVYLIEPGLDRFTPVAVVRDPDRRLIYMEEVFPIGPEDEVRDAFIDRKESVSNILHIPPSLDLAFRFATYQRMRHEEYLAELERKREAERRLEEARKNMGTGMGRRNLAAHDFEAAARAALGVGGATFLDARQGRIPTEMVVQYRVDAHRLECVCEKDTLRITDAGICLEDHHTGEKGDTYFSLESLPAVVRQAIRENKLVVWRHVY